MFHLFLDLNRRFLQSRVCTHTFPRKFIYLFVTTWFSCFFLSCPVSLKTTIRGPRCMILQIAVIWEEQPFFCAAILHFLWLLQRSMYHSLFSMQKQLFLWTVVSLSFGCWHCNYEDVLNLIFCCLTGKQQMIHLLGPPFSHFLHNLSYGLPWQGQQVEAVEIAW